MSDAGSIRVDALSHATRGWPSAAPSAQPTTSTLDREWDPVLICIAAYVLTAVGRVHDLFPTLSVVRPAIVTGLLSIILFALDGLPVRRWKWIASNTTYWLMALFAWSVLSIPGAVVPGHSFDFVLNGFIKTVIMVPVVAGVIRGRRDVERIASVVFWAAALYATVVLVRFDIGEGSNWRLGHLYYYDANDFATFAVAAMPIGVYLAYKSRSWFLRILTAGGLVVLSAAFARSGSRGGFLALLATGLFLMFTLRGISIAKRVAALAVVGVVLLVAATDRYWTQMGTILSDTDYNQTEETGRLQIWQRGVVYVAQHPVLGVGADNFQAAEGLLSPLATRQQYGVGVKWSAPHNTFLQVCAELGIPGLVFFAGMLASAFRSLRRPPRSLGDRAGRPPVPLALKTALSASLVGFIVGSLFLSLAYTELLYTLIALAIGVGKIERRFRRSLVVT